MAAGLRSPRAATVLIDPTVRTAPSQFSRLHGSNTFSGSCGPGEAHGFGRNPGSSLPRAQSAGPHESTGILKRNLCMAESLPERWGESVAEQSPSKHVALRTVLVGGVTPPSKYE